LLKHQASDAGRLDGDGWQWRIQDLSKGADHGERAKREQNGVWGWSPGAEPLVVVAPLKLKAVVHFYTKKVAKS